MPFVQGNSVSGAASLAYPGAVTVGDTLVFFLRVGATPLTGLSASDTVNGAWTNVFALNAGSTSGDTLVYGYFQNSAAGTPTITVSWTGGGTMRFIILEYGGVVAASVDQVGTNLVGPATGPTAATASVTTTSPNETIITALEVGGNVTATEGSAGSNPTTGWTQRFTVDAGKILCSDVEVASIGTYNNIYAITPNDAGSTVILTLIKPSVAAPAFVPGLLQTRSGPGLGPRSSHRFKLLNAALPTPAVVVAGAGGTLPIMGVG